MKIHTKEIEGFKMEAFKDPCGEWVILSTDKDGYKRSERYPINKFTMKSAVEFHASMFKDF